jgi:hypothetical protein
VGVLRPCTGKRRSCRPSTSIAGLWRSTGAIFPTRPPLWPSSLYPPPLCANGKPIYGGSLRPVNPSLKEVTPRYLAIENVPGFRGSITHSLLLDTLARLGFAVQERVLCPTAFGIPNRRERYYLVAGRTALRDLPPPRVEARSLRSFLDREPPPGLRVDPDLVSRYRHALNIVDPLDSMAVASCFTAAYGHSPIRSGSYLKTPSGLRRFSPTEILRLLGFPKSYTLPADLPVESAWRLVGNSLSLHPVRYALSAIPELSRLVRTETRAATT